MADQSLDVRRMAKEQESRMASSAAIGFQAVKPLIQFQASVMRLFAQNFEVAARNYERSFEAVNHVNTQHGNEARRDAA